MLRPAGAVRRVVSNRCFPTKAVAVWLDATDAQHVALVRRYFEAAEGWSDVTRRTIPR